MSLVIPLEMFEIETSYGGLSNQFSPAKPMRTIVLKTQIKAIVNGLFNKTKMEPIMGLFTAKSEPKASKVGMIAIGNNHINKCVCNVNLN